MSTAIYLILVLMILLLTEEWQQGSSRSQEMSWANIISGWDHTHFGFKLFKESHFPK